MIVLLDFEGYVEGYVQGKPTGGCTVQVPLEDVDPIGYTIGR